jgi:hypothetical protein
MNFDLRLPIGLLFSICGTILILTGIVQHVAVLGINVNLWWGIVMLVFGLVTLYYALRARWREKAA